MPRRRRSPRTRGSSYASAHAAELLCSLRSPRAVFAILSIFKTSDPDGWLHEKAAVAIERFGPETNEALLAALPELDGPFRADTLLLTLARNGRGAPRIRQALLDAFPHSMQFLAGSVAEFGDPTLLPVLQEALDAAPLDDTGDSDQEQTIVELAAAIKELGGALTRAQQARLGVVKLRRSERWDVGARAL